MKNKYLYTIYIYIYIFLPKHKSIRIIEFPFFFPMPQKFKNYQMHPFCYMYVLSMCYLIPQKQLNPVIKKKPSFDTQYSIE